jgi:phytol kinase
MVAAGYLGLFALAEVLRRTGRLRAGASRALVHVAGGLLALPLPLVFTARWPVVALAIGFAGLLALGERWDWLRAVHTAPERRAGVYLFPVALCAVYLLAAGSWVAYATAVLALGCGDAAAGLVGRRYGRHAYRLWGAAKTIEGSAAGFGTIFLTTLLAQLALAQWAAPAPLGPIMPLALVSAAAVALVCTVVEAASPWGTDNLSVPLAALTTVEAMGVLGVGVLGAVARGA